jgi:hypothetical protein
MCIPAAVFARQAELSEGDEGGAVVINDSVDGWLLDAGVRSIIHDLLHWCLFLFILFFVYIIVAFKINESQGHLFAVLPNLYHSTYKLLLAFLWKTAISKRNHKMLLFCNKFLDSDLKIAFVLAFFSFYYFLTSFIFILSSSDENTSLSRQSKHTMTKMSIVRDRAQLIFLT